LEDVGGGLCFQVAPSPLCLPLSSYLIKQDFLTLHPEVFYNQGGETVAQVAQRGGGRLIPRDTQDQAGWGAEHPDPAAGVPVHCRGVGLCVFKGSLPTQAILWFYKIMA